MSKQPSNEPLLDNNNQQTQNSSKRNWKGWLDAVFIGKGTRYLLGGNKLRTEINKAHNQIEGFRDKMAQASRNEQSLKRINSSIANFTRILVDKAKGKKFRFEEWDNLEKTRLIPTKEEIKKDTQANIIQRAYRKFKGKESPKTPQTYTLAPSAARPAPAQSALKKATPPVKSNSELAVLAIETLEESYQQSNPYIQRDQRMLNRIYKINRMITTEAVAIAQPITHPTKSSQTRSSRPNRSSGRVI